MAGFDIVEPSAMRERLPSSSTAVRVVALALLPAACAAPVEEPRSGRRADAIIAGSISGAEQDAVVLLHHAGAGHQTCTATMVADRLLVTARHCVSGVADDGAAIDWAPQDLQVFVGAGAFGALSADPPSPAAIGRELVTPSSRGFRPDIAFVVLDRPLQAPIAPIRLDGSASVGERLEVVGFGLDETGVRPAARMRRTGVEVYAIGPGRSRIGERLEAGELVFGEAACSGDSGGPAFSEATGALVAVASRVGNGTTPRTDAPAAFCLGDDADDVYVTLAPAGEIVARAFAAAGATPSVEEREPAPPTPALARAPLDDVSTLAPGASAGCRMTSPTSPTSAAIAALAAAAFAALRRRARRERAR